MTERAAVKRERERRRSGDESRDPQFPVRKRKREGERAVNMSYKELVHRGVWL